ncbi:MAG: hypothetical protein HOW97_27750 [Catenulispora sp.]|nr:hypothetical protein [Catenulispora sp.]
MDTEHSENERMRRLLGSALDDVEFEADVVPAVLSGYDRTVRTRRYRAAGAALAVLAVASGAAALAPGSHRAAVSPGQNPTTTGSRAGVVPPSATDPAGCGHPTWNQLYRNGTDAPNGTLSADPAADRANCRALVTALAAVFPELRVMPRFLLQPNAGERDRLADHPEDPANVFVPDTYTLFIGTDNGTLDFGYGDPSTIAANGYATECANAHMAHARCTPLSGAHGWHGALYAGTTTEVAGANRVADLTDGRGHTVLFSVGGVPLPAAPGAPPITPAGADAQWATLFTSPALGAYLDGFVDYQAKLPPDPAAERSPGASRPG